jgi:hypothetical protein
MISSALPGSKRGHHRQAGAGPDPRVQAARLPEGVKQRQRAEDDVLVGDAHELGAAVEAVVEHVRVRELGALGRPGRAGGVEDDGGVRAVALDVLRPARRADEQLVELARGWQRSRRSPPLLRLPQPRRRSRAPTRSATSSRTKWPLTSIRAESGSVNSFRWGRPARSSSVRSSCPKRLPTSAGHPQVSSSAGPSRLHDRPQADACRASGAARSGLALADGA